MTVRQGSTAASRKSEPDEVVALRRERHAASGIAGGAPHDVRVLCFESQTYRLHEARGLHGLRRVLVSQADRRDVSLRDHANAFPQSRLRDPA
jgi:hypothetical protein